MIKAKLATALAAFALLSVPGIALAQQRKGDTPPVAFGENAEKSDEDEAPVAVRTYAPINYDAAVDPENVWVLDLSNGQRVKARLMADWAPGHVARIKELTREGFYDGVVFHRVIEGFMAQGGDPTGTGQGIVFYPRFSLDKKYTNFGRVIENMEAVDAINRGEPPASPTFIVQASIAADGKAPPPPPAAPAQEAPITADMLSAAPGK